jgi:hypothetical protein
MFSCCNKNGKKWVLYPTCRFFQTVHAGKQVCMKHLLTAISILLALLSCRKPDAPSDPRLVLSETTVLRGEIVTATVTGVPAGATLSWEFPYGCVPNAQPDSSKVSLFHTEPGEYQLKVHLNKNGKTIASFSSPIQVKQHYYVSDSTLVNHFFPAGEELALTPTIGTADSSLTFIIHTTSKKYVLNTYIVTRDWSVFNQKIKFSLIGLQMKQNNEPPKLRSASAHFTGQWYEDGTYPIEIYFNKQVYKGIYKVSNYRKTNEKHEFVWPYSSGLVFVKNTITRD